MRTRAEAEARLARCALRTAVAVADVAGSRRSYAFNNPDGSGRTIVEIDANPSDQQLQDLSRNIPVSPKNRAAALAIFREP